MASILTLKGIDNAISNLNYNNKNTLKYRYVQHIRQFYSSENSVESVGEIDNEELIKILWDTDGSPEDIKKKRKNLNSLRSSVNADLKNLYGIGKNPEGVKIGPGNIFIMLEDAKDKILNKFGYDLRPDETLKLDQIMDILKLANKTVSGSMADEEKSGKDGLRRIDQLKGLIKGLSEKVGFSPIELPEADHESQEIVGDFGKFEKFEDFGEVSDEIAREGEADGILEEVEEIDELEEDEVLEAVDDLEEVWDETAQEDEIDKDIEELEEDEVLEAVDDLEEVWDETAQEDEIEEDLEDLEEPEEDELIEEVEDIEPDELAGGSEDGEADGGLEGPQGAGIGPDDTESGHGPDTAGAGEKDAGAGFQSGDTEDSHARVGDGVGSDDAMGSGPLMEDGVPEVMETDDSQEAGAMEDLEDLEEDEVLEAVDDLEEVWDETEQEDEIEEDLEDLEEPEEDELIEEVEDVDINDTVEETAFDRGLGGVDESNGKDDIKKTEGAKETQEIGLPVDSLGQEYSDEVSGKIKKDRLLAEEFDGYLGVMDRYYNHYILIPGGEYIVGSQKPGKDERPEQLISLSPFYIGRFPVTNGLFQIFVEKTGYKTLAEKVGYGNVYYGRFQRRKDGTTGLMTSTWNSSMYCETVEGACWYQPCGPGSTLHNKRNHPVVQISLEDAMAFAAWTGKRLPSENEWEAASRTAKGWIFPWGKEWKKHSCNIEDSCTGDTTPVEKYAEFENDFGIVDTIGNVLEWTMDEGTPLSDNQTNYRYYIAKGGSWISRNDIRLFRRFKITPESHSNILGFRCVAHSVD